MNQRLWAVCGMSLLFSTGSLAEGSTTDKTPEYGKGGYDEPTAFAGKWYAGADFGALLNDKEDNTMFGAGVVGYQMRLASMELSLGHTLKDSTTLVQIGPRFHFFKEQAFQAFVAIKPVLYAGDADYFGLGVGGGIELKPGAGWGWHVTGLYDKIFAKDVDHITRVYTGIVFYF